MLTWTTSEAVDCVVGGTPAGASLRLSGSVEQPKKRAELKDWHHLKHSFGSALHDVKGYLPADLQRPARAVRLIRVAQDGPAR
jgi:hypothetical protein